MTLTASEAETGILHPDIPLGDWVSDGVDWLTSTFSIFFDVINTSLTWLFETLETVLRMGYLENVLPFPPYLVMIVLLAAVAWKLRSWKFAVFTVLGFYLIEAMNLWDGAMSTIALVVVAAFIATVLAVPLGIWAARSNTVSGILRPILDFMQTLPVLVYLIPAVVAFGVGVPGGIVATIVFAMPPGVRFTELAIRQVDEEVVEAGNAFGSTPARILRQIQLPLALPTIMAGINQVIMLALSMVVLAAYIGAAGLGREVIRALARGELSPGVEAGVAVVIVAIFLDRVVASLTNRAPVIRAQRVRD